MIISELINRKDSFFIFHKILIILFFALGQSLHAQEYDPDSTISSDFFSSDTCNSKIEYLPNDIILIPADYIYNHEWSNVCIRQKSYNDAFLDTSYIVLKPDETFHCPWTGKVLSHFGPRGKRIHTGTDVKLYLGDTVRCAFDGKVRIAKYFSGYGNMVLVRHFNGLETMYAHLSKICVNVNQDIKAGDLIGLGGRTGRATTEHLHFETRFLGEPFNSEEYIDFQAGKLLSDTIRVNTGQKLTNSPETVIAQNAPVIKTYTIKKGDTLYSISRKYNTTVDQLCRLNKISKNKVLKIGAQLVVN